jgi:hypothetical protein
MYECKFKDLPQTRDPEAGEIVRFDSAIRLNEAVDSGWFCYQEVQARTQTLGARERLGCYSSFNAFFTGGLFLLSVSSTLIQSR